MYIYLSIYSTLYTIYIIDYMYVIYIIYLHFMVLKSPPVDFVLQERTVGFLAASVFSVAYVAAPIHVARNKWWSRENPWGWIYCGSIWDMMGGTLDFSNIPTI
jgi:hypothetical protein